MFALDPVIQEALIASASIVMLTSAWSKWRDMQAFEISVSEYQIIPEALLKPFAWAYVSLETLAGIGLLLPVATSAASILALCLMALVTTAITVNLLRGRTEIDCGCGGPHTLLSWSLVARNVLLMAAISAIWFDVDSRSLTWLDTTVVLAAAAGLFGLYTAVNQLLANHPQLIAMRK